MHLLYYKQNYTLAPDMILGATRYEALTIPHHELFCFSQTIVCGMAHYWSQTRAISEPLSLSRFMLIHCTIWNTSLFSILTTFSHILLAIGQSQSHHYSDGSMVNPFSWHSFYYWWVVFHVEESTENASPILELYASISYSKLSNSIYIIKAIQ